MIVENNVPLQPYNSFGIVARAQNLVRIARLILTARGLGVRRVDVGPQASQVIFDANNRVDPAQVIRMMQKDPSLYRLEGPLKLRIARGVPEAQRLDFAAALLARLTPPAQPNTRPPASR